MLVLGRNALGQLSDNVSERVRAAGAHQFRVDDEFARKNGWRTEVTHGGFGRIYRDPRFDQLIACPDCLGAGQDRAERSCGRCDGSGRLRLSSPQRERLSPSEREGTRS